MEGFKVTLIIAFISCYIAYTEALGVFNNISSEEFRQLCIENNVNYIQMVREGSIKIDKFENLKENCMGPKHKAIITNLITTAGNCFYSPPTQSQTNYTITRILEHECARKRDLAFSIKLPTQCPKMESPFEDCTEKDMSKLPMPSPKSDSFFNFLADRTTKEEYARLNALLNCKRIAIQANCNPKLSSEYFNLMENHHTVLHY